MKNDKNLNAVFSHIVQRDGSRRLQTFDGVDFMIDEYALYSGAPEILPYLVPDETVDKKSLFAGLQSSTKYRFAVSLDVITITAAKKDDGLWDMKAYTRGKIHFEEKASHSTSPCGTIFSDNIEKYAEIFEKENFLLTAGDLADDHTVWEGYVLENISTDKMFDVENHLRTSLTIAKGQDIARLARHDHLLTSFVHFTEGVDCYRRDKFSKAPAALAVKPSTPEI